MNRVLFVMVWWSVVCWAPESLARPSGPRKLCDAYPDIPSCTGSIPSCYLCHNGAPAFNAFGYAVAEALWADASYTGPERYDSLLGSALSHVEGADSDGDGLANLEELELGTDPSDPLSHEVRREEPSDEPNPFYDVGVYDPRFAYKRVMNLYCGRPPTFEEVNDFVDQEDTRVALQQRLRECLSSSYWRGEGLYRLADKRVRPLKAVGFDGLIPLADYAWDYRLFSYILTDDRDARELLRADYHIDENGERVEGVIAGQAGAVIGAGGQPLEPERRAGMLTTQWFLVIHTMFSQLPRTTAAQAYRAYLGVDIAKSEGIWPVEGEPRDVDQKGVAQPTCAVCHSTIDPLSYAFAEYEGIGRLTSPFAFEYSGTYNPTRTPWGRDSVILGQPVADLPSWAAVAASSKFFQRNLTEMFWVHALGRKPLSDEMNDFLRIVESLPDDGYSANRLIERVVLTDAFGVP